MGDKYLAQFNAMKEAVMEEKQKEPLDRIFKKIILFWPSRWPLFHTEPLKQQLLPRSFVPFVS